MKTIKKNDANYELLEKGYAKEHLSTLMLETPAGVRAYGVMANVMKKLAECAKLKFVAFDFLAIRDNSNVEFFYKMKELGNTYTVMIYPNGSKDFDTRVALLEYAAKVLEQMDEDDVVCYKYYKTDVLLDKVQDAANHIVSKCEKHMVEFAGHKGYIFRIEKHPSIEVDMCMWDSCENPVYAFVALGWNKAFPLNLITLVDVEIKVINEFTAQDIIRHQKDAITPAISVLRCFQ